MSDAAGGTHMQPTRSKLVKLLHEYATHTVIGGVILLLTGIIPEEYLAEAVRNVRIPTAALHLWHAGIDIRVIPILAGVVVIVGDVVLRRQPTLGIGTQSVVDDRAAVLPPPMQSSSDTHPTLAIVVPQPLPPVRYCTASDGVHLAYMVHGEGPCLVIAGQWLSHLQLDWEWPARRYYLERLGRGRSLLRYDARGTGLSDRRPEAVSAQTWVSDLETVVDAAGFGRFALYGASQTASVTIGYAARHPARLTRLIIVGGYARGWKHRTDVNPEEHLAMITLTRLGWDRDDPAFRQMFTTQFMPGATREAFDAFTERGRRYTSGESVARYLEAAGDINVVAELPKISVPTLVMHVRDDQRQPFEMGREIAAGIPGARLVALPGRNHILQQGEPAQEQVLEEIDRFLR